MLNATNSMLVWNPNSAEVALFPWPDTERLSRRFRMSGLACYKHVRGMDFEQRKAIVFIEAMHLIVRDRCSPEAVHNTLLQLEEYRDGCSDEMLRTWAEFDDR